MALSRKFRSGRPGSNRRPSAWESDSGGFGDVGAYRPKKPVSRGFDARWAAVGLAVLATVGVAVFASCSQASASQAALSCPLTCISATQKATDKMPPNWQLWVRVGRCEQPGDGKWGVNWSHRGPSYEGGLGFAASSWDAYKPKGYPENAGDATWRQQMVTANRLWDQAGWGWGCDVR